MSETVENRCRLVLVTPETDDLEALISRIEAALSGGDVRIDHCAAVSFG